MRFLKEMNRRTIGAVAVSAAVLVPLGVVGGPALASSSSSPNRSAASQYQYQITICHKTHSATKPWVQVRVSSASWKAHQKHGDFLVTANRACPPTTPTSVADSTKAKGKSGDHEKHGNNDNNGGNGNGKGKGKGK